MARATALGAVMGGVVLVELGALATPRPTEPYRPLLMGPPCFCSTDGCGVGVLDSVLALGVFTSRSSSLVSGV